jgi:Bacterial capsule synthesis protein PGA_cap
LLFVGAGSTAEAAWKPVLLEKNGIKVGWLGMTRWLNGGRNPEREGDPHVAFFPYPGESLGAPGFEEGAVLDAIKAARAQCDLLVVSIHWGVEYATAPNSKDMDVAHDMLEAGAGMVIGHHPHVLQPIETYVTRDERNTVILYSLGNFLSNQSRAYVGGLTPDKTGEPRDSLVVQFAVIKRDYGPAGIRVELGDMGILPVWTENNSLQVRAGHAKTLFVGPIFIDREIRRLQARYDQLDQLGAQLSPEQKTEMIQVSNRLQMLKHRRELILARTGDEYVVAPPNLPDP